MVRDGTGPSAISNIVYALHGMFAQWEADGRPLPDGNPVRKGVVPKWEKAEHDPLTIEQVRALRDKMPGHMRAMLSRHARVLGSPRCWVCAKRTCGGSAGT